MGKHFEKSTSNSNKNIKAKPTHLQQTKTSKKNKEREMF